MKKQVLLILAVLTLVFFAGCSMSKDESIIGMVDAQHNDETAIKEVTEAYYKALKNFTWEDFNKEAGMEYWTEEGKTEYLKTEAVSLEESVKKLKISSEFKGIQFQKITVNGEKALVNITSNEKCNSEVNENLQGVMLGNDELELRKIDNCWRIHKRTSTLMKIDSPLNK